MGSAGLWGQLESRLTVEDPRARASGELTVIVLVTNTGPAPEGVDWPATAKAVVGDMTLNLERESTTVHQVVDPGGAVVQRYSGSLPVGLEGLVPIEVSALSPGRCFAEIIPVAAVASPVLVAEVSTQTVDVPRERRPRFADNLSFYEPLYFVVGPRVTVNAKFQLGFKYRMLSSEGQLERGRPIWENVFFGYTQTSLWDLESPSAPFLDTSYKPGFFYLDYFRDVRFLGLHVDSAEGGYQHESNGQGGERSRSLNQLYIRPTFRYGPVDDWHVTIVPKVWIYIGDLSDNPDIADYRGYLDLVLRFGHPDGFEAAATLRKGTSSGYGSIQVDLTYPLDRLFFGNAASYLQFQYFNGWGETLLNYDEKLESQYRIGFSIFR